MNEDGSMAKGPELEQFAKKHQLKIGTIADLIHYRALHDTTIERIDQRTVATEFGEFNLTTFRDSASNQLHFAMSRFAFRPSVSFEMYSEPCDQASRGLGRRKRRSKKLHLKRPACSCW